MPWELVVEQLGLGLFEEDIQALVGLNLFSVLASLVLVSLMASLGLKEDVYTLVKFTTTLERLPLRSS